LPLFTFPVGLSKFSLEELSSGVSRKNVGKVYTFRDLVTGNLGSRVRNNLFLSSGNACPLGQFLNESLRGTIKYKGKLQDVKK